MTRTSLPNRRECENFEVMFANIQVLVSLGEDRSGAIREVFLSTRKAGTPIDIACRDTAILISLCLQHGCDPETVEHAITKDAAGAPEGLAGIVMREIIRRSAS